MNGIEPAQLIVALWFFPVIVFLLVPLVLAGCAAAWSLIALVTPMPVAGQRRGYRDGRIRSTA